MTIYPTLGDEGIAHAMNECDAVAVFTSLGLLPNVLKSIKGCDNIKSIVYYSELHAKEESAYNLDSELEKQFEADKRTLYSFDTLVKFGGGSEGMAG